MREKERRRERRKTVLSTRLDNTEHIDRYDDATSTYIYIYIS